MKNKNKLAQITLFVILGLILVFVLGIGIYFVSNISKEKSKALPEKVQQVSLDTLPIKTFTEECIKRAVIESAYEFGQQQGYYNTPKPYLDTSFSNIAYYYYKGKDLVPDNKVFEKEFAKIIEENLLIDCTDFSIFENLGYNIEFNYLNATTSIFDEEVSVNIDYPLSIKKGNAVNSISKFSYKLPFRIGHINKISKELVNAIVEEPYALDLTLLLNYDVDISVFHYDACNDVYIISDNQSKTKYSDDDYVFTFAVRLDDEYCNVNLGYNETAKLEIPYPKIENNNPVLEPIQYLTADVSQEFIYKLNATDVDNDTLFYLTEGLLQNYTNVLTGFIKFTPNESDIGLHLINATVVDINSGSDSKEFYLEIK